MASAALAALQCAHPGPAGRKTSSAGKSPNILLILTDDQGWGDIHSHGNEVIDTPVLDALAASGARFDRFYVSPVCAPTRASLLTGRYNRRTNVHGVTRGEENMRASETTLAETLKAAGYATGAFGKWHNGAHFPENPNGQGFDEFVGFTAGHLNDYFDAKLDHNGKLLETHGFMIDALTDLAMKFMADNRARPFLAYVPFNTPHSPWEVPDRYFDKYKAKGLDDETACAYGMVENIDENVGRLLAKLDELGLANDTIVLFLSDNGPATARWNGDMRGIKGSTHEGGVRVPLFMRFPGRIPAGLTVKQPAAHIDLLPTLVELTGVTHTGTEPLDGISLVPLLSASPTPPATWADRPLFSDYVGKAAVRTARWRAVRERDDAAWELYDMVIDPNETQDVAGKQSAIVSDLAGQYERYFASTGTKLQPLPIQIGHAGWDTVDLPAHEANLRPEAYKGISYNGERGFAHQYIIKWTDRAAFAEWPLDVVTPGTYEISVRYAMPKQDVGAKLVVEARAEGADAEAEPLARTAPATLAHEHDPPELPTHQRAFKGTYVSKEWATLSLGPIALPAGRMNLSLRIVTRPGPTVGEIKGLVATRIGG